MRSTQKTLALVLMCGWSLAASASESGAASPSSKTIPRGF
jgi:hypothetical protein